MSSGAKRRLMVQPLADCAPVIGRALWMLEDARRRTWSALEDISPDAIDRPGGITGHTIGTLLYHITAIELDWLYSDVVQQQWPAELVPLFPYDVRDEQGRLTAVRGESIDAYRTRLDIVRRFLLTTYRAMSPEEFQRPREMPDYTVTPEWVLHHLCQHEAEHRDEIISLGNMASAQT